MNTRTLLFFFILLLPIAPGTSLAQQESAGASEHAVIVNGVRLKAATVQALERGYNVRIQDGRYWYDPACGAWGFAGGPTVSFILPGLELGGPLQAEASGGTTGVFVNGRELPVQDVRALQQIVGQVVPGRYWLDAYGNVGYEGGPAFLNLVAMAQQAGVGRGNTFYRSSNTGIGAGSSGGTSYVMGKDWSVTTDH